MDDIEAPSDTLRIALWFTVVALVVAVPPIWPYGFYVLLRLTVTAASIYAIFDLGTSRPLDTIALGLIALLFNPLVPVHFPKAVWAIIDLGTAAFLWSLINRRLAARSGTGNALSRVNSHSILAQTTRSSVRLSKSGFIENESGPNRVDNLKIFPQVPNHLVDQSSAPASRRRWNACRKKPL